MKKGIVPNRINQARLSREMSMVDLANFLEVTSQAISQYEQGKIAPKPAILNRMSEILDYPVEFFYKEFEPVRSAASPVLFRSGKTASVKSKNACVEKIKIFCEVREFLSTYIDFPMIQLPVVEKYIHEHLNISDIEELAITLREHWRLGLSPINNLLGEMEKRGVSISTLSLKVNKIDGFSQWINEKPIILIGSANKSNARIRFTAAHEMAHLLLHADKSNIDDESLSPSERKRLNDQFEDEANLFAGAFLLPAESFKKDIYSTSLDHFIQLKAKWKVSISAMIKRCESLGILTENQLKYLKDQMTGKKYWHKEPLDNMPTEKPVACKQAIHLLMDNGVITTYDIINKTGISLSEMEGYCFLESGYFDIPDSGNIINFVPKLHVFNDKKG